MRLLPLASELPPGQRRLLRAMVASVLAIVAAATAHTVLGIGGAELDQPIRDWASSAVYVLVAVIVALRVVRVPADRGPWALLAAGVSLYGAGNLLWALWLEHVPEPPIPSVCDLLWLSLYPAAYAGVVWLARSRGAGRAPAGVWLDGIVAGLGIAAIGAAIVFRPVLATATGSALAVTTNLAYPIGDLLLAALVMGVLALRGWRLDRQWGMLGGGFLVLAVADSTYLLQVANGSSDSSIVANLFYMSGVALLALAAWQPRAKAAPRPDGWSMLVAPGLFVVASLGLLVLDHFRRLDVFALALALLTVCGAVVRTGLTFKDVRALAETRRQALTDDLTGLPNRRLFLGRLDEAIAGARATGRAVALLIVDLDHFKELNDALGHHAGDALLRQIGPRLSGALRAGDTVARLGGDEFGVILAPPADADGASRVAEKLLSAIAESFQVEGLRLQVGASIGIALFPEHGLDGEELLQRADVAMYQAKGARTGSELYARERDTHSRERFALVGDLRAALENGEIGPHFQPIAESGTRRIVGVEALVRWRHPERGMLSPAIFLPLAEQAGLMRTLTRRVLGDALAACRVWRDVGHDLHVSVNVTATDLLDAELPIEIAAALADHDLPAEALVVEITESSVMSDPVRIGEVLARLADLGVGLSLDDFGTGYSSLTHLRALPVGEIKVDRSFVGRMATDSADAVIVRATIRLAHDLGMRVVAEGVEDEATWAQLAALGAELVQGYALGRPVPAAELELSRPTRAAAPAAR